MRRYWAAALLALAVAASAQTPPMSAREIFYGKGRASVKAAVPSPTHTRKPADRPASTGAATTAPTESATAAQGNESAQFQNVGLKSLGLKYTILKRQPTGEYIEVDRDTNFSEGDQLRLELEPNESGYLYVVNQGSSKRWTVLYPRGDGQGSNRVQAGQKYSIPARSNEAKSEVYTITSPSGAEKLFVILSRNPEANVEDLIYRRSNKNSAGAEPSPTMLADNRAPIQDDLVQRLRKTYSRDLIIENVDDSKLASDSGASNTDAAQRPGRTGEKAVYVVNPNARESTVVADIVLRHQ